MSLSSRQIRHLRGLAHPLKPLVAIGNNGLTDSVVDEINNCISRHELIKVRVSVGDREERDEIIQAIVERADAEMVQRVGHVATIFKRNEEKPRVEMPKR